ncbi:MAG: NYN domain-containing protein [Verrucomicrobiota bacterium JB022]|nr:NYN domain-containing protein [Verrucomicrobiota bacterium JB022]
MDKTAVLIDGSFFLRRYRRLVKPRGGDALATARYLHWYALQHANDEGATLYRIFYYDCPPLNRVVQAPISGQELDFGASGEADFRRELFSSLKRQRKLAIRLGELRDGRRWNLRPDAMEQLLRGDMTIEDLADEHFSYDVRQDHLDTKIALDIASLALKGLVQRIVLISGDSNFVPAAKLARREGIDFVLDPMWSKISEELFEHIDGLKTFIQKADDDA